jgi:hypothetical protein
VNMDALDKNLPWDFARKNPRIYHSMNRADRDGTPARASIRRSKPALDPAHRFIGFHRIRAVGNRNTATSAVRCHRQAALKSQRAGPRHSKLSEPKINQFLTKLVYLEFGHSGRVCWLSGQPLA